MDALVFNIVFTIIHLIYIAIVYFTRWAPVKLDPIQERMYKRDFHHIMNRRCFKRFIDRGYLRCFNQGTEIISQGSDFSSVYYIASIHPDFRIEFKKGGKEYLSVRENAWMGVTEYIMMEKERTKLLVTKVNEMKDLEAVQQKQPGYNKKKAKQQEKERMKKCTHGKQIKNLSKMRNIQLMNTNVKWSISASVVYKHENQEIDEFYDLLEAPVYIYEFSLKVCDVIIVGLARIVQTARLRYFVQKCCILDLAEVYQFCYYPSRPEVSECQNKC